MNRWNFSKIFLNLDSPMSSDISKANLNGKFISSFSV